MFPRKLVRDVFLRALRRQPTKPIRKRRGAIGGLIEQLEDRTTPANFLHTFGGTGFDHGTSVAADSSGNVFAMGTYDATMTVAGTVITPHAPGVGADTYLAKFAPDGSLVWVKSFGAAGGGVLGASLGVDGTGSVIFTGHYTDPSDAVNFGGGPLGAAASDMFVVKLDGAGNHLYSRRFGDAGTILPNDIAVDAAGNAHVGGQFTGTADFGGGPLASAGSYDGFVVRFDGAGNHAGSRRFGDSGFQAVHGVATDAVGNTYITGEMEGTADFGGGPLTSAGDRDIFVAKYDAAGSHVFSTRYGDATTQTGFAIAVAPSGQINVTGQVAGTTDFGGGVLTSNGGSTDVFLLMLSPTGTHLFSQVYGDNQPQVGRSLATDAAGNVYLSGSLLGTISTGFFVQSAGSTDGFIAKFDPNGTALTARRFGGTTSDFVADIAASAIGNVYFTGHYSGTPDFGVGPVANGGLNDAFVVKFDDTPTPALFDPSFGGGDGIVTTEFFRANDTHTDVVLQPDGKIVALLGSSVVRYNANGTLDPAFGTGGVARFPGLNINYAGIALQPDGKVVVVGTISSGSNSDFLAVRFNANGTVDTTFDGDGRKQIDFPGSTNGDIATSVAVQPDGKIVVAGETRLVSTSSRFAAARLNPDGSLDPTFDGDGTVSTAIGPGYDNADDVLVQSDGKIVLVGQHMIGPNPAFINFGIVRYNPDGSLDTTFDFDGTASTDYFGSNEHAHAVAQQADGKLVVTGFVNNGGNFDVGVVRYNTDGSLDATFGTGGRVLTADASTGDRPFSIAVDSLNRIVVGNYAQTSGGVEPFVVLRYNPNGTPDGTFDGDGKLVTAVESALDASGMALRPDDSIVVVGHQSVGGQDDSAVAQYLVTGAPDTAFGTGGVVVNAFGLSSETARAVALQPDGKIVVVGTSNSDLAVTRYLPGGAIDTTFGGGDGIAYLGIPLSFPYLSSDLTMVSAAVQPDGKILAFGTHRTLFFTGSGFTTSRDFAFVRLNPDGTPDTSFDGDGIRTVAFGSASGGGNAMVLQPDGKIVGVGSTGSNLDVAVVRLHPNGSLDGSFGSGGVATTAVGSASDIGLAVALQSDGKLVVAGQTFGGTQSNVLVMRYNANGTLDGSFNGGFTVNSFGVGVSAQANAVALQADGKVVISGQVGNSFLSARYTSSGVLDTTFDGDGVVLTAIGWGSAVARSVVIQADGRILASGSTSNGTNDDIAMMRYNTDGSIDSSFGIGNRALLNLGPTNHDGAFASVLQSDGKLVIAGVTNDLTSADFAIVRIGAAVPTLAAAFDGSNNLVVTDTAGMNNSLTVKVVNGGTAIEITDGTEQFFSPPFVGTLSNGNKTLTIPFSAIPGSQIILDTAAGNDTLTMDLSGGTFAKALEFNGGTQAGTPGDGLVVVGSGTQTAIYTPSASTFGNGVVTTSAGTITFTGLEPVDITGMAVAGVATPPPPGTPLAGGNNLSIATGTDFLSGGTNQALRVTGTTNNGGTTIESVALWNNTTVVIDTTGTPGNDTIAITSANNAHGNANLTIVTGTETDAVNVNGPMAFTGAIDITTVNVNSTAAGTISTGTGLTVNNTGVASTLAGAIIGGSGGLSLVNTVGLNNVLAVPPDNYNPQGLGYDPTANELLFLQQSTSTIYRTDLNGNILGSRPIGSISFGFGTQPDAHYTVSVAADATQYYFSDYTANNGGFDLYALGKVSGAAANISTETAAFGGYPIDVRNGLIYRTQPTTTYSNSNLNQIRIATTSAPDTILNTLTLNVPAGIADFSVDTAGNNIWVLEYSASAAIRQFDLTTGNLLNTYSLGLDGLTAGLTFAQGNLYYYNWNSGSGSTLSVYSVGSAAAGGLTKQGAGTLTLNAVNTFTGGTTVNGGILQLGVGGASGTVRGTLTINPGAEVQSLTQDSFGFTEGVQVSTLAINGGTLTQVPNSNLTLGHTAITMKGGLIRALGGANSRVDFFDNGSGTTTLTIDGTETTTAVISSDINLRQVDSTFTVGNGTQAVDLNVTGSIIRTTGEGNGALRKSGLGTMSLSAANTYNGGTTVNDGTLLVNNPLIGTTGNISFGGSRAGAAGVNTTTNRIYATQEDVPNVTVIDGSTNAILATVPTSGYHTGVAVNTTTNRIYVGQQFASSVRVIDGATNTTITNVAVASIQTVGAVAVNATTNRIYVIRANNNDLAVIDGATNIVTGFITLGLPNTPGSSLMGGVAVDPTANRIYVVGNLTNSLYVVDGATNSLIATIPLGGTARYAAVNPTTHRVYVTLDGLNSVAVIDGTLNTVLTTVALGGGAGPLGIDVDATTNRIYVSNNGSGTASVIDGVTNAVLSTLAAAPHPGSISVLPSINRVIVQGGDNAVHTFGTSGTGTGTVVVNAGGTLGGTGTVGGTVSVNAGGTVAPGTSPGILYTGSVSYTGGALAIEIAGTTVGTQYDRLNVAGTVALGNGVASLNLSGAYAPVVGDSFTIIANDGGDATTGYFAGLPEGAQLANFNTVPLFITYAGGDGNDVVLNTSPTVNGTSINDTLVLRQVSGNPALVEYNLNDTGFVPVTSALPFAFNGGAGTDLLLVDTSNGDPISTGNVSYSGEILRVERTTGGAADSVIYSPGTISVGAFGSINFSGTSNVDLVNLTAATIRTGTLNDTIGISDSSTATNGGAVPAGYSIAGVSNLALTGVGVTLGVRNVGTTTIDTVTGGGDGDDAVAINGGVGAHGNTNLTITTGAGTDTVTVSGALTLGGALTVTTQTIAVDAAATVGSASLTAGGGLSTSAAVTASGAASLLFGQGGGGSTATIGAAVTGTPASLTGGAGNDTVNLNAGSSALSVSTGAGDDAINFGNGVSLGTGTVDGGANVDTISYSAYSTPVQVNLGSNATGNAFQASLDGLQEVPGNPSLATAAATLTYDTVTRAVTIAGTVTGMTNVITDFHIHVAVPGVSGPVVVPIGPGAFTPAGPPGAYTIAAGVTLPALSEAAFVGGATYLNIHTNVFPGGEVRGQVLPGNVFVAASGTATGTGGISNIENATGGTAADSLVGDLGVNVLNGNAGNDTVVGSRGNDVVDGGANNDVVVWSNGDGSDVMDGGADSDTVLVNGNVSAGDVFTVGAGGGGRVAFARNPAPFSLDIGTTETLRVNGAGGNDGMTVGSLAGVAGLTGVNLFGMDGNDTFTVQPGTTVAIAVHGGNPTAGTGDTLILSAVGVTDPVIAPTPALPDGSMASSSHATVSWTSIETFPVPLGLGGTFDFDASADPGVTQAGFLPVLPTDTAAAGAYAFAGVGWVAPVAGFDRIAMFGTLGAPDSPRLSGLLRDGAWGYAGGGANNGVFRVAVAPGEVVQVTAFVGDTFSDRDNLNVYVSTSPAGPFTRLNPDGVPFTTNARPYDFISYSGAFDPGPGAALYVTIDTQHGGSSGFWTITGLDVRPVGLVAPVTVARADAQPLGTPVPSDGTTVDTYVNAAGTGVAPFAELTVGVQYGAVVGTDADPAVKGFQILADATGGFAFQVRRPLGTPSSLLTVTDVTGASGTGYLGATGAGPLAVTPNPYLLPNPQAQAYSPPPPAAADRFDFNTGASPTQPGFRGVQPGDLFSSAAGYGWVAAAGGYDRGAGTGGTPDDLFRDGHWGQGGGTFAVSVPAGAGRDVRVYVGDPYHPWPQVTVAAEGGAAAAVDPAASRFGFVTLAGTDADNDGVLTVTVTAPVWVVSGLDVAVPGQLPAPATGAAVLPPAGRRLDLDGPSAATAADFTAVPATAGYTPAVGYGWAGGVNSFERTAASLPGTLTAVQTALYRDGAWNSSTGTYLFGVAPLSQAAVRVYVGDSYTNWQGITLGIEGGSGVAVNTNATPYAGWVLTGADVNGDGVLTVTVTGGAIWVVNGFDVVSGPASNLPPEAQQAAFARPPAGGVVPPLTAAELQPIIDEAVRRWAAAGADPVRLAAVRFRIEDRDGTGELGAAAPGLIRIDDDAVGAGWFVDATPADDAEFGLTAVPGELRGFAGDAAARVDLLTVVMHELGHELGRIDVNGAVAVGDLMSESLGVGTRRRPAGPPAARDPFAAPTAAAITVRVADPAAAADAVAFTAAPVVPARGPLYAAVAALTPPAPRADDDNDPFPGGVYLD